MEQTWSNIRPKASRFGGRVVGFAQSPQAVPFDEFVRIYFSCRKLSKNGKFLSVIRFVDIDKTLENILYVHKHDVIDQGQLGNFDEHGIFPFNVLRWDNGSTDTPLDGAAAKVFLWKLQ